MIASRKVISVWIAALLLAAAGVFATPSPGRGKWSGTVASVHGDDLALAGVSERFRLAGNVTELLSGRALSPQDLAPGSAVTLRIEGREADGRFRVSAVTVVPKDLLRLEGPITDVASDGRSFSVMGVRIELGPRTGFSGRGPAGMNRSVRQLSPGATASVTLTVTAEGTLEAAHVRLSHGRGRSGRVVGGRSSEPGEDQEIRGTVTAISDSAWTIDARTFQVDAGTVFLGDPGLGDFVEVRFHLDAADNAVADRIQKEDGADDEMEFRGIVEAVGAASWTISGRVVRVNASTFFRGNPGVGDLVEVRADRAADGTLTATAIKLEDGAEDGDDEREFRGVVEVIGSGSWTVGGRVVLVNAQTAIFGNPQVGDMVEVRADRSPDGTLTATDIKVEDGPEDGDDEREFRGIVSSIGASSWTIGDLVVLVNGATVIEGNPQVGDLVEVRADRASDGTLTATRIKKEDDGGGGDDDGGGSGNDDDDDDGGDDNGGGGGNSGPGGGH